VHIHFAFQAEASRINRMKDWPANIQEASNLREDLLRKVKIASHGGTIKTIAGVDVAYSGGTAVAAAVLYDPENLDFIEETVAIVEVRFPYIPGYLFFREGPVVMEALKKLERRPDLLMVDGHGTAHPKLAGYASLLGAYLEIPSVGCAKSRLVGTYEEPARAKGACSPLIYKDAQVGSVVRSRDGIRPVFVSPGHLITLDEAVAVVLRCTTKYRIPEPIRRADALAGKTARLLCNRDVQDKNLSE
jgi:deoxyribonuclease V